MEIMKIVAEALETLKEMGFENAKVSVFEGDDDRKDGLWVTDYSEGFENFDNFKGSYKLENGKVVEA